jgi:hypothetical protein
VFLDGKTLTSFFVIKLLVVFYFFIIIGNGAFKKVKAQLLEIDHLMKKTI